MQWQDWVFSVGGFLILASMVPTIRGDQKPALATSVLSVVLITTFTFTMASLGLWLSALANAGCACAWGVLALQRWQQQKPATKDTVVVAAKPESAGEPAEQVT